MRNQFTTSWIRKIKRIIKYRILNIYLEKKMQNINIQVLLFKENPICHYFCTSVRQASSAQSAYCKHTPCCLYVCLFICVCVCVK